MDSEEYSFLEQIRLQPEDLSTRLIYADWLEDQGDPRSELIRIQCEMAELLPADPELNVLKSRERGLLDKHKNSWLEPFEQVGEQFVRLDRGLLSSVVVDASWFVKNSKTLFELVPSVSRVRLRNVRPVIEDLARLDCSPLTELDLSGNLLLSTEVARLSIEGLFAELSTLNLDTNRIRNIAHFAPLGYYEEVDWLVRVGPLNSLDVDSNGFRITSRSGFLDAALAESLIHLDLSRNVSRYTRAADLIGKLDELHSLTSLELECNRIGDLELREFAATKIVGQLTRLSLASNQIGYKGCGYLVKRELFGDLLELNLAGNRIDDRAAMRLAHSDSLQNLRRLDLRHQWHDVNRGVAPLAPKTREALREKYGYAVLFDDPQHP